MDTASLVFTHANDPSAQITCVPLGSAAIFSAVQPMPIVSCRLTGDGNPQIHTDGAPVPQGFYRTADEAFELNCNGGTANTTCNLRRYKPTTDMYQHGMFIVGDCPEVCGAITGSRVEDDFVSPTSQSTRDTARTSVDPLLRDSAGAKRRESSAGKDLLRAGMESTASHSSMDVAPVCMLTFRSRPVRIPIFTARM